MQRAQDSESALLLEIYSHESAPRQLESSCDDIGWRGLGARVPYTGNVADKRGSSVRK